VESGEQNGEWAWLDSRGVEAPKFCHQASGDDGRRIVDVAEGKQGQVSGIAKGVCVAPPLTCFGSWATASLPCSGWTASYQRGRTALLARRSPAAAL